MEKRQQPVEWLMKKEADLFWGKTWWNFNLPTISYFSAMVAMRMMAHIPHGACWYQRCTDLDLKWSWWYVLHFWWLHQELPHWLDFVSSAWKTSHGWGGLQDRFYQNHLRQILSPLVPDARYKIMKVKNRLNTLERMRLWKEIMWEQ